MDIPTATDLFELIILDGKEENLPKESGKYTANIKGGEIKNIYYQEGINDSEWVDQILSYFAPVEVDDWVSVDRGLPTDMRAKDVCGKIGKNIVLLSDTAYYDKEKAAWFDHSNDLQLSKNFISHWRDRTPPPPKNH